MRVKRAVIIGMLCAAITGMAAGAPAGAQSLQTPRAAPGTGPVLFLPEKAFEFQPVIEGTKVVHDYVIMNRGTAALIIDNVRTG